MRVTMDGKASVELPSVTVVEQVKLMQHVNGFGPICFELVNISLGLALKFRMTVYKVA